MSNTIIGLFDDRATADSTQQDLIAAGFDRSAIDVRAQDMSSTKSGRQNDDGGGFWDSIKDLFGVGDDDTRDRAYFAEAARRGGVILAVDAPDNQVDTAVQIIQKHHPVDIQERAAQWQAQGWTGEAQLADTGSTSASSKTATRKDTMSGSARTDTLRANQGAEAIPVVQEELRVGKRQVQRGGVRVISHVTETPVEENVELREEHVNVERRPVDRPVQAGDIAFQERAVEATESAEEAVVDKKARVVEEVVVNKDVQSRKEKVRDSVRRTDVDVQKLSPDDDRLRPAYAFADELAADQRYRGRSWEEIESDARTTYERRNPGSTWEQVKDTVRAGWDRARGKARR